MGLADEAGARTVVKKFFDAFRNKDVAGAMALWSDTAFFRSNAKYQLEGTFARVRDIQEKDLVFESIQAHDSGCIVTVAIRVDAADTETGKPAEGFGLWHRIFFLINESGAWKIDRYLSPEQYLAARIAESKTEEKRQTLIADNKNLVNQQFDKALYNEGRRFGIHGEYDQAVAMFGLLRKVAGDANDEMSLADAVHGIGAIYDFQGRHAEALDLYEQALKIRQKIGDQNGIGLSFLSIAVLHSEQEDHLRALEYDRQSLAIYNQLDDKASIATVLANMGACYHNLGDFDSAMKYYQNALDVLEQSGNKPFEDSVLANIGLVETERGNYLKAMAFYQQALNLARSIGDNRAISSTLMQMGINHFEQANTRKALEYFEEALKISSQSGDKGIANSALLNLGSAQAEQANYAGAIESFNKLLKSSREIGDQNNEAFALGSIGSVHLRLGEYSKAIDYFQQSLQIAEKIRDQRALASTLASQGEAYLSLGNYQKAIESTALAGSIAKRIDLPEYLIQELVIQGRIYARMGENTKAKEAYREAIAVLEGLRNKVAGGEEERQIFLEKRVAPYYEMADLLAKQGAAFDAFSFAELSKARTLLDVLGAGKVSISKEMTPEERETERSLYSRLVSLNAQKMKELLSDKPDQNRLANLGAQLSKAQDSYDSFHSNLYIVHTGLQTQRGDLKTISLAQCAELIPDAGTALIEFLVSGEHLDIFVITREKNVPVPVLRCYSTDIKGRELSDLVKGFRERIAKRDLGYAADAAKLFDVLLRPAARELAGKSKLVIVPDGVLWELPFQALESGRGHSLTEDCAISYAPSLTALREMSKPSARRVADGNRVGLLAFGNSVVQKERSSEIKEVFMDADLEPLPQAETQVKQIGQLYGVGNSRIYVGADATETRLKAEAGRCRILHIATHGIIDNVKPMYSEIVLSRAEGSDDDGLLEAWEIANMDLNTDLVVLSACDTAGGRLAEGEGIIGLTWAFFVAGCPSTVVSQWSVEVGSTSELMVEFHRNLLAGFGKADALRRAELKLMKDPRYAHPFYWAGFVVVGKSN